MQGHYGLENRESGRISVHNFELVLGYLVEDAENAYFVIHIKPTGGYISELNSGTFLGLLGYTVSPGSCPFFQTHCYYRYIYGSSIDPQQAAPFNRRVEYAHKSFRELGEALPGIYEQVHDIYRRLGYIPDLFPSLREYGPQPLPDFSQDAPAWIQQAKVDDHRQVEAALNEAQEADKRFKTVEYILWGTGDDLEGAVHLVLEDLGFEVTRTPKGATIDRIAGLPHSTARFGLEITGLNEGIKKKSNKITQALSFLQHREGTEKPVILANTFNDLPLEERTKETDFTEDALDLMQPNGIVGMTTATLYEIWKAVSYGGADIESIAQDLYNHPGGEFKFPSP
jgi:hypothetical protein